MENASIVPTTEMIVHPCSARTTSCATNAQRDQAWEDVSPATTTIESSLVTTRHAMIAS